MTYYQSEINDKLYRSSSYIKQILNLGLEASARHDWLSVVNQLRLLPLAKQSGKTFALPEDNWNIALKLAIDVLLLGDFQEKWEVSKIFPLFGCKIIQPLIVILEDEALEVEVRWFTCRILGKFSEREVIVALIKLLQQTEPELIDIASQTLTSIGTAAIDALVQLLPQSEYRLLAVQSLACIRRSETITPLINVVNDPDAKIRTIAIEALGSFHDSRIPPILITALQDTASSVRKQAAIALGFRQDCCHELNLVKHLQPLLYDLNLPVCRQAAISLSRMQTHSAVTALFEVLQSSCATIELQIDIVRALGWSEIKQGVDYLGEALKFTIIPVSQEIITVLGRISSPQLQLIATQILVNFCHGSNQTSTPQIKQALALSLGELKNHQAKKTLEIMAADENQIVRLHAIAALKKLANISPK